MEWNYNLKKDYAFYTTMITFFGSMLWAMYQTAKYISFSIYAIKYNIDINTVNILDSNIICDIIVFLGGGILFLISGYILNKRKLNIKDIIYVLIYNIVLFMLFFLNFQWSITCSSITNIIFSIIFILFLIFIFALLEKGMIYILQKTESNEKKNGENSNNDLKSVILTFIILIVISSFSLYPRLNKEKIYLIEDNKIILYTTKDNYFVADTEIKGEKIIINIKTTKKISNENKTIKKMKFKEIKLNK